MVTDTKGNEMVDALRLLALMVDEVASSGYSHLGDPRCVCDNLMAAALRDISELCVRCEGGAR